MIILKPPLIISPPPIPENLKSYLVTLNNKSTIQNRNFLKNCFDLKDLVKNLTMEHYTATNDDDDDQKYLLGTQFLLNFILIPLFLFLFSMFLLLTVYFLYNR